jgi:hypothetical protein
MAKKISKSRLKALFHRFPLLYVCHQSRTVALKTYRLSFAKHLRHPVYFNPNRDTVMLNRQSMIELIYRCDHTGTLHDVGVQRLACDPTTGINFNIDKLERD